MKSSAKWRLKKLRQTLWRMKSKRPEPGTAKIEIVHSDKWGFAIKYKSDKPGCAGLLTVDADYLEGFARVGFIQTSDKCKREGVGTLMYEVAARESCKRLGLPLASDEYRSSYSDAFWKKQFRKGRATEVDTFRKEEVSDDPGSILMREKRYKLTCPPPKSLARAPSTGRKARKRSASKRRK